MIVRELITKLSFQLDTAKLKQAEAAVNKFKSSTEKAATKIKAAFGAASPAGGNTILGGGAGLLSGLAAGAAALSVVKTADSLELLRMRLSQMPQHTGTASAALDEMAGRATKIGVSLDSYGKTLVRIGHASKDFITDNKELLDITDTLNKSLILGGTTTAEAASATLQFSQALGAGKLNGDEYRAMAEAAPQFMSDLAAAMGIPRASMKELGSEGKLVTKDILIAMRTMKDSVEKRFKEMPMTAGRAWQIVTNRFELFIDKLNRRTRIFDHFEQSILSAFDAIEKGGKFVIEMFGGIENTVRFLGIALGALVGGKVLALIAAFSAPFLAAAAAIGLVALVLEDLYVWISGNGNSLTGELIGPWDQFKLKAENALRLVTDVLGGFFGFLKTVFTSIGETLAGFAAILVGVFTLDWELIKQGFSGILTALGNMFGATADVIYNAFKKTFDSIAAEFRSMMQAIDDNNFLKSAGEWLGGKAADIFQDDFDPNAPVTRMGPSKLAPSAMGSGKPNISNNTNVTVTVPPGTTAEQATFLQNAAQKSFNSASNDKLARDMAVYAP